MFETGQWDENTEKNKEGKHHVLTTWHKLLCYLKHTEHKLIDF